MSRSTPSSTTFPPNDFRSPAAAIIAPPLVVTPTRLPATGFAAVSWRFHLGPARSTSSATGGTASGIEHMMVDTTFAAKSIDHALEMAGTVLDRV
nr:hypothetical protein [Kibdelosporangium sp. MJ126-NF4]CTQ98042.1 hypothetical protein [Kibdelosporangium sp. MJ126-NF4]